MKEQITQENLNSDFTYKINLRLFEAATMIFIVAPILGEGATYYFTNRLNESFPSSIAMIFFTLVNYYGFTKTKNLSRALLITSFVQLLCYCEGIIVSGGLMAAHIVYMPIFPVFNGFSFGRKGAILSTLFVILFCLLLAMLDSWGFISPPKNMSAGLLAYQTIGATFFTNFIVVLFVELRQFAEQSIIKERAKTVQKAKLASLGEMAAGMAHEINNPLAIIYGNAELLTNVVNDPEKFKGKIQLILKSCQRIEKIVKGLRKFSRSGEKSTFEPISIHQLIQESLTLCEQKFNRTNTQLFFDSTSKAKIFCNEIEIEQVLVNLINNAIDAVQVYPEKWIKVLVKEEASAVIVQIIDSGKGISEENKSNLFSPFFTTKKIGEGTGLGLSIAKGILEDHNASISLLAKAPNTCFEIRFIKFEETSHAA